MDEKWENSPKCTVLINVDFIFILFSSVQLSELVPTVAGIGSLTMSLSTLALMSFNFSRRQTVTVHGWGWSCQLLPMTSVTFVLTFLTFCCGRIWRRDWKDVWYVCISDWNLFKSSKFVQVFFKTKRWAKATLEVAQCSSWICGARESLERPSNSCMETAVADAICLKTNDSYAMQLW